MEKIVSKVKSLILESNVSLLSLSKKAQISRVYIYSIMNGETNTIKYDKLCKICDALNVDVQEVLKAC